MPLACIAADVIIGSPGETEELFMETHDFINSLELSYLHVFTYSDRPEARANKMGDKVHPSDKKSRSKRLHELGEKKKRDFYKSNTGTDHVVLWEASNKNGYMTGLTDNYIPIFREYQEDIINTIEPVKLEKLNKEGEWTL